MPPGGGDRGRRSRSPPPSERAGYHGPGRFRHAGDYEVEREWNRYEGTPQRELLRVLRERFLTRGVHRGHRTVAWAVEVGPGPGRFSPLAAEAARTFVLVDLSRAMLEAALEHTLDSSSGRGGRPRVEGVLADATRSPLRARSVDRLVALGNVVGFSGPKAFELLGVLAEALAPGGRLMLETAGRLVATPRFMARWRRGGPGPSTFPWNEDPRRELPRLLQGGWVSTAGPAALPSEEEDFRFVSAEEVRSALVSRGLAVLDQTVVAPLTGDDPETVASVVARGGSSWEDLVRWEEGTGTQAEFLRAGGHVLTLAERPSSR